MSNHLESPASSWRDFLPWNLIFRSLGVAICIPVLIWAIVGLVVTPMGWIVFEYTFVSQEMLDANPRLAELAELNHSPYRGVFRPADPGAGAIQILGVKLSGPWVVFDQLVKPFRSIFLSGWTFREFLYLFCGCIWTLAVWTFAGLAITRVAMLKLTRGEDATLDDSFDFAVEKFMDGFGAVGMPLLGVFALCIPAGILGLFMGFDFGVMLVGMIWILLLLLGVIIGLLLLGLLLGWPLMIASVSAEGQNSFDAMTRAYAYVFQRPMHYLFYCLIAVLFGGICWLVIGNMTNRAVELSYWAASWGANLTDSERIEIIKGNATYESTTRADENAESRNRSGNPTPVPDGLSSLAPIQQPAAGIIQESARPQNGSQMPGSASGVSPAAEPETQAAPETQQAAPEQTTPQTPVDPDQSPEFDPESVEIADGLDLPEVAETESATLRAGRAIIGFWNGMLRTVAAAFIYGLFWCMACTVYLLLRRDVDETEMDEIYMVDEKRTYDLPPLQSDENGIPQVQTPVPRDESVDAGEPEGDT